MKCSQEEIDELTDMEIRKRQKECFMQMANEYESGKAAGFIFKDWQQKYMDRTGTKLTRQAVTACITRYCDKEYVESRKGKEAEEILKLKEEGKTVKEIKEIYGCSDFFIYHLREKDREKKKPDNAKTSIKFDGILQTDIDRFAEDVKVGSRIPVIWRIDVTDTGKFYKTKKVKATLLIESKYKHFCMTDHGCVRWADLYRYWKERYEKNSIDFDNDDCDDGYL